jgi:hypothetical protein
VNYVTHGGDGGINLQATLSASSAMSPPEGAIIPHHPITCTSDLHYDDDGTFGCTHADVPPGDLRTQFCIDHSIALLLIELSRSL